jgi:histidinol-phosphate aminotransferase
VDADLTFIANPNSPSGTVIDPQAISQLAQRIGRPVVLDEAYVDFAEESGLPFAGSSNLILTRTLSKSYALAGIRFGFAVASPEVVRELVKVKDSYNCDVLSLTAAAAAIQDREYLAETRRKIIATRERLTDSLRRLGFDVTPSQANFVWARRSDRPVKGLYEAIKARRILVRYMSYPDYGDGLRVTVGTDAEIDVLLKEMAHILSA